MLGANRSRGSLNKIVIESSMSCVTSDFQWPVSYNLSLHFKSSRTWCQKEIHSKRGKIFFSRRKIVTEIPMFSRSIKTLGRR